MFANMLAHASFANALARDNPANTIEQKGPAREIPRGFFHCLLGGTLMV